MWIFGLIFLIGTLLTVFAVPHIKNDDAKPWVQLIILTLVTISVVVFFTSHPEPITNMVEAYQKGHIIKGNPKYNWDSKPLIFTDEGKTMVALKSNDGNYTIIPHESYMQIKKIVKENL